MLKEALNVVEAARALGLVQEKGRTRSTLDVRTLAQNLEGLRGAIESFDKLTSISESAPVEGMKPAFATPPQLDDENYVEPSFDGEPGFMPGDLLDTMEDRFNDPEPKAARKTLSEEERRDRLALRSSMLHMMPAIQFSAARRPVGPGMAADYSDFNDTVLFDNDETVGDFMMAIDRVEDVLAFAANKNSNNPRLKNLAQAVMEMRKRLVFEIKQDGAYLRVPAHVFSSLLPTIADAVMETDLRMAIPELRAMQVPKRSKETEFDITPGYK